MSRVHHPSSHQTGNSELCCLPSGSCLRSRRYSVTTFVYSLALTSLPVPSQQMSFLGICVYDGVLHGNSGARGRTAKTQHGEQTVGLVEQFSSMCESVLAAVNFVVSPTTSFLSANRSGSTN